MVKLQKLSLSAQIIIGTIMFMIGVVIGDSIKYALISSWPWLSLSLWWFTVACCLTVIIIINKNILLRYIATALILIIFGCLYSCDYRALSSKTFDIVPGSLEGNIINFPIVDGQSQKFIVSTSDYGNIQITTSREPRFDKGSKVHVSGKIDRSIRDDSVFAKNSELKNITLTTYHPDIEVIGDAQGIQRYINFIRAKLYQNIVLFFPEPDASLAAGLTLGLKPAIDDELSKAFQITNLTHLAAVSGANLSITILFIFVFLRKYWLRAASLLGIFLTIIYLLLVGAEASIIRAGIITIIFLLAPLVGRPPANVRLLVFTALAFTLQNPLSLTRDISFLLSFFAFAGLLILTPEIESYLSKLPEFLKSSIAPTLGATVAVFPIQVITFGSISFIGPIANLFVAPFVPTAMAGSFASSLIGLISGDFGKISAWLTIVPIRVIEKIAIYGAKIPWASTSLNLNSMEKYILIIFSLSIFICLLIKELFELGDKYK